jgi:hypothetical protein
VIEIREPEPEDPPALPPHVMVIDSPSPELVSRLRDNHEVIVMRTDDPRLADMMTHAEPVMPTLPPMPDMSEVFADPREAMTRSIRPPPARVESKPPPCAGHSRLGRPVRVGGEARRPGTADAEKRAKRKAAEKSRRRNRK